MPRIPQRSAFNKRGPLCFAAVHYKVFELFKIWGKEDDHSLEMIFFSWRQDHLQFNVVYDQISIKFWGITLSPQNNGQLCAYKIIVSLLKPLITHGKHLAQNFVHDHFVWLLREEILGLDRDEDSFLFLLLFREFPESLLRKDFGDIFPRPIWADIKITTKINLSTYRIDFNLLLFSQGVLLFLLSLFCPSYPTNNISYIFNKVTSEFGLIRPNWALVSFREL